MSSLITQQVIERILTVLTEDAGHTAAVIRTLKHWNAGTDGFDISFHITDASGTSFNGYVPGEWLTLMSQDIMQRLIDKYPLAFAPKHSQAELVAQKIESAIGRALEAIEAARAAVIELREATK